MTTHAEDDDEFGLSSSDEAEMLNLTETVTSSVPSGKRKLEDEATDGSQRQNRAFNSSALSIATAVLQDRFGLSAFRLKQAAAIQKVLEGQSALVVFPTGTCRPYLWSGTSNQSQAVASHYATKFQPWLSKSWIDKRVFVKVELKVVSL